MCQAYNINAFHLILDYFQKGVVIQPVLGISPYDLWLDTFRLRKYQECWVTKYAIVTYTQFTGELEAAPPIRVPAGSQVARFRKLGYRIDSPGIKRAWVRDAGSLPHMGQK
jgi:hypothetical protein